MDKKLTDSEIVKALEWYVSKFKTAGFVYMDADGTHLIGTQDVLDLINRQKAEIEAFKDQEERANNYCKNVCEPKYKTEIERKKGKISRLQSMLIRFMNEIFKWGNKNDVDTSNFSTIPILEREKENLTKQLQAEAYKECIEKVKAISIKKKIVYVADTSIQEQETGLLEIYEAALDNLLKELVGEDK